MGMETAAVRESPTSSQIADSDQARLAAHLKLRDTPCPACGFNLRDLSASRCPECGLELKLVLDGSEALWRWVRWPTLCLAVLLLVGEGMAFIINALDLLTETPIRPSTWRWYSIIPVVWTFSVAATLAWALARCWTQRTGSARAGGTRAMAFLLLCILIATAAEVLWQILFSLLHWLQIDYY